MEVTYAMTIRLLTRIGILVGSAALATLAHGQQNAGDKLGKQSGATAAPVLKIQVQKPIAKVSPMLYGLMTEEINYSYDGGLYAELVRNRTFQDDPTTPVHWSVTQNTGATSSIEIDKTTGPSEALTLSLKWTIQQANVGARAELANEGYWGVPVRPKTTYKASFYAMSDGPSVGDLTVSLTNDKSGKMAASTTAPALSTNWKQYSVALTTGQVDVSSNNHLVLSVGHPGVIWLSMVSLFPPTYKQRPNGNRIDIMEKLAAMKPAFLRFPGGNYLEGDHIPERFPWKKTIGPLVDRPTHPSPWRYQSSDGLGLLEFLEWCEDLNMEPLLAVYAGYSLMQEHVTPGPDLERYVADALDEIEYVTGSTETKWGAQRARDGHSQPFHLAYVEIGNEDFADHSNSYDARYAQFYKAIKAKYPALQLIATTKVNSMKPDVIDEHYYPDSAKGFFDDVQHYDATDRNGPKIFVGEWATREGQPTPNFAGALGDAAWMTGMERDSDIVVMACYAPLFVNVNPGGMQWKTDLIGYDALSSYGSPAYYEQVMFSNHHGDEVLESKMDGLDLHKDDKGNPHPLLFYSVTRDAIKGTIYLKVVNAAATPQPLEIKLAGASKIGSDAMLIRMKSDSTGETNTITVPTRIIPVQSTIKGIGADMHQTFPGYSISVLEMKRTPAM